MKVYLFILALLLLSVDAQRQRRRRREDSQGNKERDITPEEVIEITEDKKIEDDPDELAKAAMMEEWDTHMSDFVPDDMLTVELGVRDEISIHEDAPKESIYMRGAYFVNTQPGTRKEDKLIDFFVLDPNYQVIFSRRQHEEGIFRFNTTMEGQYSFVFSNMKDRINPKQVTLAIHPGYESDEKDKEVKDSDIKEMAKAAGVDELEIKELNAAIRKVYKNTKNLMTEAKMSMIRQDAHNKAVEYNSRQNVYVTLFEAAAFMGICAFNLYHIKGILENRRII